MRYPTRHAGISSSEAAGLPGTSIGWFVRSGAATSDVSAASSAASILAHGRRARIAAVSKWSTGAAGGLAPQYNRRDHELRGAGPVGGGERRRALADRAQRRKFRELAAARNRLPVFPVVDRLRADADQLPEIRGRQSE